MTDWIAIVIGFSAALVLFVVGLWAAPHDRQKRFAAIEEEKANRRQDMHDAVLSAQKDIIREGLGGQLGHNSQAR